MDGFKVTDPQPTEQMPARTAMRGAPRFSALAAEAAAKARRRPMMVNPDQHPVARTTLHLTAATPRQGRDETPVGTPDGDDGTAE